ncbi:MAG: DUF6531 domain-containing protein [Pseudomonadota bacterium]|nr:DUF6531 domain-containing protein [Pseudomonadota bacterium]
MDFDSILGAGRRKVAHKGQSHAILSLNQFSRSLALLVLALLMPVASQAMTFQSLVHETCKFRGEPLESYREESLSTCIDLTSGSIETTNLEGCGYWHVRYAAERWCRNAQPDDTCIGNPIQLSTLTKVQTETDYQTGGLFPVSIRRTYSSDSSVGAGAFGPGWHGDYERYMMLSVLDNGQYVLYIRSANGSEIRFNPSTGAFVTPGVEGKVYARPQVNNQQEWVYQKPDGSEDVYLSDGLILDQKMLLIESTSPTGDRKTFSYSNGRLATMTCLENRWADRRK